jgi:hypothetical protein
MMKWQSAIVFLPLLAIGLVPSWSGACSVAPFNETWSPRGTVTWVEDGTDCVLQAGVALARPAAADVHYRRADRTEPLRLSFVLALPPALGSMDETRTATLASATARSVPIAGPAQTALFRVRLTGDASSTHPSLTFDAACASAAGVNGLCSTTVPVDFSAFPLRITLALQVGGGSGGRLDVWLGDDTAGPPTVALADLDNARWGGVDRVSLGLSDVSESMYSAIGSEPFSYGEITSDEQRLFWSDFESNLYGNVVADGTPITGLSTVHGNTCDGSMQFPSIASGTTEFSGPTVVHSLSVGPSAFGSVQLIPGGAETIAFMCPAGSGPSGPCVQIGGIFQDLYLAHLTAGDYQIVVGRADSTCGTYHLSVTGVLD